jgi:peroxiredoxin
MRWIIAASIAALSTPVLAALPQGSQAPQIATVGAIAGKPFKLDLKQQLKKGAVVLYFFPKAFTKGCTLEAHAFSEAAADFKKAGAQVIGMSADNLDTLKDFSAKECRDAFPVATATPEIQKAYDVAWAEHPGLTTRTSYVIAKDGKIAMVHNDIDWSKHVALSMEAVKSLKR